MEHNSTLICAFCQNWLPLPGQDEVGLCGKLSYPHNRTFEHDACLLKGQVQVNSRPTIKGAGSNDAILCRI